MRFMRRAFSEPFAFAIVLAAAASGCTRPDTHASASVAPPASSSAPSVSASALSAPDSRPAPAASVTPPASPSAPSPSVPAAGSPEQRCGATHLVVAGDTVASVARACYGDRTYQDLLQRKNALKSTTLRLGKSLATPPLRDLVRCAPAEVCEPIFSAHAAFREAPPSWTEVERLLAAALAAAEAKKITRPRNQLKNALEAAQQLHAGFDPAGYGKTSFHQAIENALEYLDQDP
jgi:hypothetical protein